MLPADGVTTMATVAVAPDLSVPSEATTVLPEGSSFVAWFRVAEPNVTPAGSVSMTDTPTASFGPLLVMLRV